MSILNANQKKGQLIQSKEYVKSAVSLPSDTTQDLVDAVLGHSSSYPKSWSLTPVKQKKPLRKNWQNEPPLDRGHIAHQLLNGTAQETDDGREYPQSWDGVGVRTGSISDGLIGIDCDGPAAEAKLQSLSGGDLPSTVSCTSGKLWRRGLFYQLSEAIQALIKQNYPAGWGGWKTIAAPGQELDFRYDRKQQVLPPSAHPETGQYKWLNDPLSTEVAPAPQWLEDAIRERITPCGAQVTSKKRDCNVTSEEWPLLPPLNITRSGETNDVLRQLANWGYNKLELRTPEALGAYITENSPKLPGWREFASVESKRDLARDRNGWGYRWAQSCCNYWISPKSRHKRSASNAQWQDWLHNDFLDRLRWCVELAKGLDRAFSSQNQLIQHFCEWSKAEFGQGFSRSTLLKAKDLWIDLVDTSLLDARLISDKLAVQKVPNRIKLYQPLDKGLEVVQDFANSIRAEVELQTELKSVKGVSNGLKSAVAAPHKAIPSGQQPGSTNHLTEPEAALQQSIGAGGDNNLHRRDPMPQQPTRRIRRRSRDPMPQQPARRIRRCSRPLIQATVLDEGRTDVV